MEKKKLLRFKFLYIWRKKKKKYGYKKVQCVTKYMSSQSSAAFAKIIMMPLRSLQFW